MWVYCLYRVIIWHKTSEVVESQLDESDTVSETESEYSIHGHYVHTYYYDLMNNLLIHLIALQLYHRHIVWILGFGVHRWLIGFVSVRARVFLKRIIDSYKFKGRFLKIIFSFFYLK